MRRATTRTLSFLATTALGLAPAGAEAQSTNDAACFIRLANEARAAKGLKQLTVDPTLTSIADTYAKTMVQNNRAVPMDNETLLKLAPPGARLLGQNVGTGAQCETIHDNFLKFKPDENRLYDPRYDKIGVGVVPSGNLIFVHEVLMETGPVTGVKPAASPGPTPSPKPSAVPSPTPATAPTPTVSPAATGTPAQLPAEASPSPTATEDGTAALPGDTGGDNRVLWIAFGLAIVAAAALGGLMQSRRSRGRTKP